jgi:CRP-like cAMP-binding protein
MQDDIAQYFRKMHPVPEEDLQHLLSHFKLRNFKKGEVIVAPGQVQKELYLVHSGVQMSYLETDQKLQVIAFTYAPNLCAIPESFCFQKASPYTLKALTESEMMAISFPVLENVLHQSHPLERLFRKMTEIMLAGMISRHLELHTLDIEERFRTFCHRSAHLLQLVPHKYIASYLGIDSTNFSKLYNQIKI